jgi:RNA polymerase sigma-70 factor (sigma-E family)
VSDQYAGFHEFFEARRHSLSRAAVFLVGDEARAEELLQGALVRTAAHWQRVASAGDPEGYVRRAMLNDVRSQWRRRNRYREVPLEEVEYLPDKVDSTSRVEDRELLIGILRGLPPRQRAVLFVRFYMDESEASAAGTLGCSIGTIKRQSHDALLRIHELAPQLLDDDTTIEANHE